MWAPPTHKRIRVRERVGLAVRLGETGVIVWVVRGRLRVRQWVQGHGVAAWLGESGEIEPGWSAAICGLVDVPKDTDTGWRSGWVSPVGSSRQVRGHLRARQCVQGHGVVVRLGESAEIEPGCSATICGLVNVSKGARAAWAVLNGAWPSVGS